MQQDRGRGGSTDHQDMKQNQDRGLKPPSPVSQQQVQQPPQKCPRCESVNTKFCYYNNYSLSQPRYFCKSCRRYWTQGGTLRNVPVGGGCRKGKRTRISSSSSGDQNSRSTTTLQPPPQIVPLQQNLITSATTSSNLGSSPAGGGSSYYPSGGGGGGFLSSLAAIQSTMNQPQPQPFSIGGGGGGDLGGSSSLGLNLQGYGVGVPCFGSQQPITQFFNMGISNRSEKTVNTYPSSDHHHHQQQLGTLIDQSSRAAAAASGGGGDGGSNSSQPNNYWHHQSNFLNDITNPSTATRVSEAAANLWSINNSTTAGANTNTTSTGASSSSSFYPNQWPHHHLPGNYGAP